MAFPPIPGDYGLTAQFSALAGPAQATICGSSSFRLDLVAKYLSADGPDEYFRRGLQIDYEDLDAKRLADDLLDEVLGVYYPPDRELPRSRPVRRGRVGGSQESSQSQCRLPQPAQTDWYDVGDVAGVARLFVR